MPPRTRHIKREAEGEASDNAGRSSLPKKARGIEPETKEERGDCSGAGTQINPAPSTPPDVYNERSKSSTELLHRLKTVLEEKHDRKTVPRSFWALCQFADDSNLKTLIELADSEDSKLSKLFFNATMNDCPLLVSRCMDTIIASFAFFFFFSKKTVVKRSLRANTLKLIIIIIQGCKMSVSPSLHLELDLIAQGRPLRL
jgi:hypothetical protein